MTFQEISGLHYLFLKRVRGSVIKAVGLNFIKNNPPYRDSLRNEIFTSAEFP
jgi:hypothetical protein